MANTTKTTKSATKKTVEKEVIKSEAAVVEEKPHEKLVAAEYDPHQYIRVLNGFRGRLVYISKRTGEVFNWEDFGDEVDMELIELKNAKSASKKFFQNNWFMFDEEDDWVIDYLGVRQFYKNALTLDGFEELFEKTPAQIKKSVAELSNGQKRSLVYMAKEMINDGRIDSLKSIHALEEALNTKLIEED